VNYSRGHISQVGLLLKILPIINMQNCFALKGGTAINLFVRDMPRLSVDIDLAYLPIEPREQFLENITAALDTLSSNIRRKDDGQYQVNVVFTKVPRQLSKLIVSNNMTRIIIEPNFVLRGSVFECETYDLCQSAQNCFSIETLSFVDLYGGKICAALARQHPRDLFDVKMLLENEGITESVRQAFVVYLASVLSPSIN
jgi:predicted nucleotidyltransferase component of viral defense system